MKLASEIIGLNVLAFDTGKTFAKVEDIIYDDQTNRVVALLVDRGGWFSDAKVIDYTSIQSVGDDAVIVPTENVVSVAKESELINRAVGEKVSVKGKQIMTEDGKDLGKVADLNIDETTGRVVGYMASGGIFSDIYNGKPYVPAPETIKVGGDVVFVPAITAELMQERSEGLKDKVAAAKETVVETTQNAVEKTKEVTANTAEKAKEVGATAKEKVQGFADTTVEKYDETKSAVKEGDTENPVAGAVEKAKQVWGNVVAGVTGATATAKEKAVETKEELDHKKENMDENSILGLKVDRVILAKDDSVILDVGEIITHEAIAKAKENEVFPALKGAAVKDEPKFTNEELKRGEEDIRA